MAVDTPKRYPKHAPWMRLMRLLLVLRLARVLALVAAGRVHGLDSGSTASSALSAASGETGGVRRWKPLCPAASLRAAHSDLCRAPL